MIYIYIWHTNQNNPLFGVNYMTILVSAFVVNDSFVYIVRERYSQRFHINIFSCWRCIDTYTCIGMWERMGFIDCVSGFIFNSCLHFAVKLCRASMLPGFLCWDDAYRTELYVILHRYSSLGLGGGRTKVAVAVLDVDGFSRCGTSFPSAPIWILFPNPHKISTNNLFPITCVLKLPVNFATRTAAEYEKVVKTICSSFLALVFDKRMGRKAIKTRSAQPERGHTDILLWDGNQSGRYLCFVNEEPPLFPLRSLRPQNHIVEKFVHLEDDELEDHWSIINCSPATS